MGARYSSNASPLWYMPGYVQAAILGLFALVSAIVCMVLSLSLSSSAGEGGWMAGMYEGMAQGVAQVGRLSFALAVLFGIGAGMACYLTPDSAKIAAQIHWALYNPARGNPLHLKDGELLPQIACQYRGDGQYYLAISTKQGVDAETIKAAAPAISAALTNQFQSLAVTVPDVDVALNYVLFSLEDVKVDRSCTFTDVEEMYPERPTRLRVDQRHTIDLTTSGSMLVAGKTRSGKTTAVIALLLQLLLWGPDRHGSQIVIIDPKRAELSQLPYTVTLDEDGEAKAILEAMKSFDGSRMARQRILNALSSETGDATKWWEAGFHPSFLFLDEYVSLRSLLPKKPEKDSDYCLDTFDALLKRIVTMGASAGCFVIVSIAEASVQDGGLPAMLRSAMSTRILFRPTRSEGLLIWDAEKLDNFPSGRIYGPGDAWFSSTDGVHDTVTYVHFPHLEFPAYQELGHLLEKYYAD